MTPELKHDKIQSLLAHFRELTPEQLDQEHGIIYAHNLSGSLLFEKCACIGANAVMALGYPPQKGKHSGALFWSFDDAPKALGAAYVLSPGTLVQRLVTLGAPDDPFGEDNWGVSPQSVFEKLYHERCRELGDTPH